MRRYGVDDIRHTLTELDALLDQPTDLTLIGGAAVALILDDPELVTKDIDAFGISRTLLKLARTLTIDIDTAAIADLPWNFEDRCSVALRLPFLEVRVPDPHDLVLSKIMRWSPGDEDHVLRLHTRRALDLETLLVRYLTEMTHAIGDPRHRRWNLLACIETLFGEVASLRAGERLP